MRSYVYVVAAPKGEAWELHSSSPGADQVFATREQALLAARATARRVWEGDGRCSGVRVQGASGGWADDVVFGEDA